MKRKLWLPVVLFAFVILTAVGCSSKDDSANPPAATEQTDTQKGNSSDQSVLTGTISEIKDFMFVVEDSDGAAYAFSFEGEKPEGLDQVANGDKVTVTYTGKISEVDAFDGEVISVKKAE